VLDRATVPLASSPGFILPDAADDTWAKIRLDEQSFAELADLFDRVPDPLARSVLWASVRESMFDAILDPDHALTAAERALPREPVDLAVESVLALLETALGRYLVGTDAIARLGALSASLLETAEPGSNRQLVAARAYLGVTTDSTSVARWHAGAVPDGLLLSTDLRWRVLYRMVRSGVAGTDAIDEVLEREPSDSARVWSFRSRAAIPDPVAKEEVWRRIVSDPDLSNHKLYALCEGFWQFGQDDLTEPFVQRFFDEIGSTAGFRSGWIVGESARLAFPRFAATPHTVELGERLAANRGLPSGVRRSISDENDELRRVVTCQQKFRDGDRS
jgi:aminopeptidase N